MKGETLTVKISNFKGRARCPYCNEMPTEMEWSDEGIRICCNNDKCTGGHYHIFEPIYSDDLDLKKATERVISQWKYYCNSLKKRMSNG